MSWRVRTPRPFTPRPCTPPGVERRQFARRQLREKQAAERTTMQARADAERRVHDAVLQAREVADRIADV